MCAPARDLSSIMLRGCPFFVSCLCLSKNIKGRHMLPCTPAHPHMTDWFGFGHAQTQTPSVCVPGVHDMFASQPPPFPPNKRKQILQHSNLVASFFPSHISVLHYHTQIQHIVFSLSLPSYLSFASSLVSVSDPLIPLMILIS